jgi:hypothetical protein
MHVGGEKSKNFIFNREYHEIILDFSDLPATFNSSFNILLKLCPASLHAVEAEHIGGIVYITDFC